MRGRLITLVILLSSSLIFSNAATASKGGVEQTGNNFVVGFTYSDNGVPSLCSGALVAPDVIATARHCVVNRSGVYGSNYVFSAPGAKLDAPIDGTKVPTGIKEIIIPQQSPTTGLDFRLDVAFIITNKAFATGTPIAFATMAEAASLSDTSKIAGYGYGAVFETGATYASLPRKFGLTWKGSYLVEGTTSLYELLNEDNIACRGDSGGPITLMLSSGKEVLLGAVSGAGEVANGCGTKLPDNFYHLRMTVFHPYINQIPAPVVSPAPKIKKIVCIKGTKKKVVTGLNPKCPKGYKLKK
jgi:hypothetical protein